jgi:hypothetical protein
VYLYRYENPGDPEHGKVFALERDISQTTTGDYRYYVPLEAVPHDAVAQLAQLRARRTGLLAVSDWTQLADAPLSGEAKAAWAAYRQALRDLPTTFVPDVPTIWPVAPTFS